MLRALLLLAAAVACSWATTSLPETTAVVAHLHNPARKHNVALITRKLLAEPWIVEVIVVAQGARATEGISFLATYPRVRLLESDRDESVNARWGLNITTEAVIFNDDDMYADERVLREMGATWARDRRSVVTTTIARCVGPHRFETEGCRPLNMVGTSVTMYPAALLRVYHADEFFLAREVVRVQAAHCEDVLGSLLHSYAFPGAPKIVLTCGGDWCAHRLRDSNVGMSGSVPWWKRMAQRRECSDQLVSALGPVAPRALQGHVVRKEIGSS